MLSNKYTQIPLTFGTFGTFGTSGTSSAFFKLFTITFFLLFINAQTSQAQQTTITDSFRVEGVCISCKNRIEKVLKVKGVNSATWRISDKILTINYQPGIINLEQIETRIADVGHDTPLKKAKDEVYNKLPDCCLYKDPENEGHLDDNDSDHEHALSGVILSEDHKGNINPLPGATVSWLDGSGAVMANDHGVFTMPLAENKNKLVISYTGYQNDTLEVKEPRLVQVILAANGQLKNITVKGKPRSTYINDLGPVRSFFINSKDLLKAACCNLSESFETNPSVDVSYSDAVTGAKQIQLLGLAGIYTQLTVENLPGPRGLATPLGLNSIAGPWIESIELSKGTGSVVNGFESIAGQINVELKKPQNSERVYLNGYVNEMGKTDLNVNLAQQIGNKWSTGLLFHDDFLYNVVDENKDGFRDQPTGNLLSMINRWNYEDQKGMMVQFGVKALLDDKTGGENDFNKSMKFSNSSYGVNIKTRRYEGFAKIGYVFPEKRYKSIGLQLSGFDFDQHSYFGLNTYNASQQNFYSNLIYQSIIGNSAHKFRTGVSFVSDNYNENFKNIIYKRTEVVPGAFFEYTYTMSEKLNMVAGLRADHNNIYGWFATPRINIRYAPFTGTTLRFSAGRGQRTANIFSENMGALVSGRDLIIMGGSDKKAYGLNAEVAWNKGISIDQKMKLFKRDAMLSVDFYRNDFSSQVVADIENPRAIKFYNLLGKSYSNSFQAEFNFIPVKDLDVRLAYRLFDVKTTYENKLLEKPLSANDRAFINFGYAIKNWKFDYTLNFTSSKRIPSTSANPVEYRFPDWSPSYFTMNAQVSKTLGKLKQLDLYMGGENLTGFMQKNSIIAADQPFGQYFDASLVWGPLSGRLIYGGIRFKIK
jgi:copper chaperone CopZ/outer membrane cobalamin receptor